MTSSKGGRIYIFCKLRQEGGQAAVSSSHQLICNNNAYDDDDMSVVLRRQLGGAVGHLLKPESVAVTPLEVGVAGSILVSFTKRDEHV